MYDDILFPTDGSAGAEAALDHAIEQARIHGATLHILYVIEENVQVMAAGESDLLAELEAEGERIVEEARDRATEAGIEAVETAVKGGSPHRVIRTYADDHDVDVIVMGTHGRSGLDRLLLGSVAERTVRTSDRPVLTVQARADEGDD
ncbi:universal stress protein [Natronomonas amylolytica]|uniref:universal stress protein n=1 Tax=Natronomonas amylolytica TaxID=3108498 RepID=UPI00300A6C6A